MIINEKRLARALKSAGAVGFRLRVAGPNLELIGLIGPRRFAWISWTSRLNSSSPPW